MCFACSLVLAAYYTDCQFSNIRTLLCIFYQLRFDIRMVKRIMEIRFVKASRENRQIQGNLENSTG